MIDFSYVKQMLLLDLVRKNGGVRKLPLPFSDCDMTKLLSFDSEKCQITTEGKKVILLFRDARKDLIKEFDVYREVMTDYGAVDARIPILSFILKDAFDGEKYDQLASFVVLFRWDDLVQAMDEGHWTFKDIMRYIEQNAQPFAWLSLAKDPTEAAKAANLLLGRRPTSLVQLTRSNNPID